MSFDEQEEDRDAEEASRRTTTSAVLRLFWSHRRAGMCAGQKRGQQAVLMLHRTRVLLIRQQTMLANAFRAHLAEFGIGLCKAPN